VAARRAALLALAAGAAAAGCTRRGADAARARDAAPPAPAGPVRAGPAAPPPAAPRPTAPGAPAPAADVPLTRIAFGSCNRQDRPQPLWARVLAGAPQLWVWTGDNIYGDSDDPAVLAAKYARQRARPEYDAFVRRVPVIGVWDDHDYGANDAGREYPRRAESQQLALDFLGEPPDGPRRARPGMYAAYTYGPPGRRVKVLLLDTRYFRDPLPPRGRTSGGDVLGDAQWRWLAAELAASDAQVHLVVSSIQVLPVDHPYERWGNFPRARQRLLATLGAARAPGVVLVSGDRHVAELSRLDRSPLGYPLYELTSSGLTHTRDRARDEPNRYRVGPLVAALNYGTLDIDWRAPAPRLTLRVHDADGAVRIAHTFDAGRPGARR
jgi:alkaline phosphatase D